MVNDDEEEGPEGDRKKENQTDIIVEKLLNDIAQMSEAPKLGEIRQDEDGTAYSFTMNGWVEVDTVKK